MVVTRTILICALPYADTGKAGIGVTALIIVITESSIRGLSIHAARAGAAVGCTRVLIITSIVIDDENAFAIDLPAKITCTRTVIITDLRLAQAYAVLATGLLYTFVCGGAGDAIKEAMDTGFAHEIKPVFGTNITVVAGWGSNCCESYR